MDHPLPAPQRLTWAQYKRAKIVAMAVQMQRDMAAKGIQVAERSRLI